MLDIFKSDAFSLVSLTNALRDIKPRPSRLGDLGLFQARSVATTTISIERIGDILKLVAPSPRGAPGETRDMPKRNIRAVNIPHFQRDWSVLADEVQNVRAFGTESTTETVMGKVMERIQAETADFDLTTEYSRIGAIQGRVLYKDSSQLDLYTLFDVPEPAEAAWDLTAVSPVDGDLRRKAAETIRGMRAALGGVPFASVHAFCGDNFFDDLLQHPEVRDTYKGQSEAAILRDSYVGPNRGANPIFMFGGIVWENYGAVEATGDGALMGIHTDKVRFVPLGVDQLFQTYYAPADYTETVNTMGTRLYARQMEMRNGKGIEGEVQMNELHLCTRPNALLRGRRGA
jgi:hypothetical protein